MKKILITGASGFIGGFLVKEALERGYETWAGVRSTSSRANLQDKRIRFIGAVKPDEVQRAMKEADVLIMNSTFEGIPMTILEAISQGLPVITTDVGGIKEVLTYGKDSEVTDGSVERIHTAMDKILLDYEAYAKAAYDKSLQFDYRKVNRKVFDVLNESLHW